MKRQRAPWLHNSDVIGFDRIPEDQMVEVHLESADVPWLSEMAASGAGEAYGGHPLTLDLSVSRIRDQVFLQGSLVTTLDRVCDRCGADYVQELVLPFRYTLLPEPTERPRDEAEVRLYDEDLEVSFYKGYEMPLSPLLAEALVLEVTGGSLCQPECAGLCAQCGANLNESPCACPAITTDNPFALLKNLKLPPQ